MHSHAMPAGSGGWMVCQCRHSKQEQVNAWLYQYCMHLIVIECQDIILYLACSSQLFYELGMRLTNTGLHSTVHPTALFETALENLISLFLCVYICTALENFISFFFPNCSTTPQIRGTHMQRWHTCTVTTHTHTHTHTHTQYFCNARIAGLGKINFSKNFAVIQYLTPLLSLLAMTTGPGPHSPLLSSSNLQ